MKHFRDLVLSTREPVLHNVLWIKPTGVATYIVYMYEDGWLPLFGGNSGDGNGISYNIIKEVSDGYIVQFVDNRDPDNKKNLYPKTKAIQVWLSNGINVEEAINNINRTLTEISLMIKKAKFVTQQLLNDEQNKSGNTYWVYTSYDENTGFYTGEGSIRKYTSNNTYSNISLSTADIVMNVRPASAKLAYVDSMIMSNNGRNANIQLVATKKDLNVQINNIINTIISDVQVDGDSVVTNRVANIKSSKRIVYIVTSDIFETDYPEGEARADKTFLIRTLGGHPTDNTHLVKYDNTGLVENAQSISLQVGDLLFNVDEHNINNDNIIPYTLYVYDTPQYAIKVHPLATKNLVEQWVGDSITDAVDSVRDVFIDFTVLTTEYLLGRTSYMLSSNSTVQEVYAYVQADRYVYARVTGIESQEHETLTPIYLSLELCEANVAYFSGYGSQLVGFSLLMNGGSNVHNLIANDLLRTLFFDNVPTQNSNNPVKSGGIYNALDDYVLLDSTKSTQLTSYNDRMAGTPKYHRAEWIANNTNGLINPEPATAKERFDGMWWAIYNSHTTTRSEDTYTPKVILFNGVPACFSDTDSYTSPDNAESFTLKFFNGTTVTTHVVTKDTSVSPMVLRVTTTVQNVTLT